MRLRPRKSRCITLPVVLAAVLGSLLLAQVAAASETIDLAGTWMFRADWQDNGLASGWQNQTVDESQWRSIEVPGPWEKQGVTKSNPMWPSTRKDDGYNGFAWYRRHVSIPAEWTSGQVTLGIGSIDDLDWTFVNGTQVGATTGDQLWDQEKGLREYQVPLSLLKPGQDNVIAIRVFDVGGPSGGIIAGPVELARDGEQVAEEKPTEAAPPMDAERFTDIRNDQINLGGNVDVGYNTKVEGDVQAAGGSADIQGWVTGDVVALGGDVTIGSEARVDGDVSAVGGTVHRETGAYIGGKEVHVSGISGDVLRRIIEGSVPFANRTSSTPYHRAFVMGTVFVPLLLAAFLTIVAVLLFPERMAVMARALPLYPARAAVSGVLGLILAPGLLLAVLVVGALAMVLVAITLVGPLIVLAGMAAAYLAIPVMLAMGCVAVWLSLGKALLDKAGRTQVHPLLAALLGMVMIGVAGHLPVVGLLIVITAIIFGCGAAVMTGVGTHEEWLTSRHARHKAPAAPAPPEPPQPLPLVPAFTPDPQPPLPSPQRSDGATEGTVAAADDTRRMPPLEQPPTAGEGI
jgi:cytoskeletal protein CcmA (bactofilin family)